MIWDFVFQTGFFLFTKKNGVLLRRTVSGDSLAHIFPSPLSAQLLPLARATSWNARHDPGVSNPMSHLIPAIEMVSMYNRFLHNQLSKGYTTTTYTEDQKTKKDGIFFGFKTGFFFRFCFVLHIDLVSGLFSPYLGRFLFQFFVLGRRPFAGTAPNAGSRRKSVRQKTPTTAQSCWEGGAVL